MVIALVLFAVSFLVTLMCVHHSVYCSLWKVFNTLFGWNYGVVSRVISSDICRVRTIENGHMTISNGCVELWDWNGNNINNERKLYPLTFKFERVNND